MSTSAVTHHAGKGGMGGSAIAVQRRRPLQRGPVAVFGRLVEGGGAPDVLCWQPTPASGILADRAVYSMPAGNAVQVAAYMRCPCAPLKSACARHDARACAWLPAQEIDLLRDPWTSGR